jgi:hypothetical protein
LPLRLRIARDRGWNVVACTIGIDFTASEKVTVSDKGATRLASRIDDHLSDRAYALEAMIKYLEVERPEILVGPRVVVGMSAGAIALPAAVARIGPVDAAVLIGGGENVAQIITSSPLFNGHIELVETLVDNSDPMHLVISNTPCKNSNKRRKFIERVLQESKLDPHHTAAVLYGTPVLMLHAEYHLSKQEVLPASSWSVNCEEEEFANPCWPSKVPWNWPPLSEDAVATSMKCSAVTSSASGPRLKMRH